MIKVIFYYEHQWAFGSIFHAACKELYKFGIHCSVLDWGVDYEVETMQQINDTYDIFVSQQAGVYRLTSHYGIPKDKIIVFSHCDNDLYVNTVDDRKNFNEYRAFAVINPKMIPIASELQYNVVPDVVRIAVHTDLYNSVLPSMLNTIGYASSLYSSHYLGFDKKRGHLVEQICNLSNTVYKPTIIGKTINLAIPGYMQSVDAVIMSSRHEMGGLPMLEAAAAGRLCIGTPTGYFKDHAAFGGGILMPMDEDEFVEESVRVISYYKANPNKFVEKCAEIIQYAKENYDWKYVIQDWVNLLTKL